MLGLEAKDIIGGGMKIAGAGVNMLANLRSYRRQRNMLNKQMRELQNWHDRERNTKITDRADQVAHNEQTQQHYADVMAHNAGVGTVIGQTNAQMAAKNDALALEDAARRAQAEQRGEAHRDAVTNTYMAKKSAIDDKLLALEQNRANGIAAATGQAIQSGSDMLSIPDKNKLA